MAVAAVQHAPTVDDVDGGPAHGFAAGDTLPSGLPAWERLGIGHRCETWLAWSAELWAPVVIKFPRPHQTDHPRARTSLRREVAALAGNLHPALPRIYEDGTARDVPYVALEYVDGVPLDIAVEDDGPLGETEAALLGVQLLAALRAIHARGLAHVDVKPDNVVLRDGRAVLLDCGSARRIGRPQPPGTLIGSAGYAAPELEAGEPIGAGMDVYGAAVTLYEALAGHPAFDPEVAATGRPAPEPLPRGPVGEIVMRLLDPRPDARPRLEDALGDLTSLAEVAGAELRPPCLH